MPTLDYEPKDRKPDQRWRFRRTGAGVIAAGLLCVAGSLLTVGGLLANSVNAPDARLWGGTILTIGTVLVLANFVDRR
jgi:hypothetical protein